MPRLFFGSWILLGLIILFPHCALAEPPPQGPPIYDIPRLEGINLDGNPDDWGDRGFRVDVMAHTADRLRPAAEFDGCFRLGWDPRGLLVLVTVTDDIDTELPNPLSGGDSIELYIAPEVGSPHVTQAIVGPGIDPQLPRIRTHVRSVGPTTSSVKTIGNEKAVHRTRPTVTAARQRTAGGYVLEALLPWKDLEIDPTAGRELAFQLRINDDDGPTKGSELLWFPDLRTANDSTQMHRVRLAEKPSPPVRAAAYGDYPRLHRTRIRVLAQGDMAGKPIEVRQGSTVLAEGTLAEDFVRPEMASAHLSLPMAQRGKPYGKLKVMLEGRLLNVIDLPDPGDVGRWQMPFVGFIFKPCVFSGRIFPEGDFEDPSYVEDLIGPYEYKTTFYDMDYNAVLTAEKPGRYGAIVQIRTEDGRTFKRFRTLFREPKDVYWRNAEMPVSLRLPSGMGINATVLKDRAANVSAYFKQLLSDGLNYESDTAVLLSGLFQLKPGEEALSRTSPQSLDQMWWAGLKRKTGDLHTNYLTYLPHNYQKETAADPGKRYPMILFLHGKGERGDDLAEVKVNGLPSRLEWHPDASFPFIVICPQCSAGEWWNPWELNAMLDEAIARYRVDQDHLYITGLSMGGYGTWSTATTFPDRFAAIAPVCGGGDAADVARLRGMPVWAFHGGRDPIVPIAETETMVNALREQGNEVRYTIFPKDGHDAWTHAYGTEELYPWLLRHSRSARLQANPPTGLTSATK